CMSWYVVLPNKDKWLQYCPINSIFVCRIYKPIKNNSCCPNWATNCATKNTTLSSSSNCFTWNDLYIIFVQHVRYFFISSIQIMTIYIICCFYVRMAKTLRDGMYVCTLVY